MNLNVQPISVSCFTTKSSNIKFNLQRNNFSYEQLNKNDHKTKQSMLFTQHPTTEATQISILKPKVRCTSAAVARSLHDIAE